MKRLVKTLLRRSWSAAFTRPMPETLALYMHGTPRDALPRLAELVDEFLALGYRFVAPHALHDGAGGARRISISFDDCFKDWLGCLDLFAARRVVAGFFVNTLPITEPDARPRYFANARVAPYEVLTEADIRTLAGAGHAIGGHSHSHYDFATTDIATVVQDVALNKQLLEGITGSAITSFAFPFGQARHARAAVMERGRAIGYRLFVTAIPGMQFVRAAGAGDVLHRSPWNLMEPLEANLARVRVDGRLFYALTGRSPGLG